MSRRFVQLSQDQLAQWLARPLGDLDLAVVMIDGNLDDAARMGDMRCRQGLLGIGRQVDSRAFHARFPGGLGLMIRARRPQAGVLAGHQVAPRHAPSAIAASLA